MVATRWSRRSTRYLESASFCCLCEAAKPISKRFEQAWLLLVGTYQREVCLPQKVIALNECR